MMKLRIFGLSMAVALGSTMATADDDTKTVIRMVVLGTPSGADDGVFNANAISISAGVGISVIGDFVANSGSIGTAVFASTSNEVPSNSLARFTTSYETGVCTSDPGCPTSETVD